MSDMLVIGYGNPLRGDDGLGWDAALALRAQWPDAPLRILTVQQLTPELAEDVSRAERAVFIDATVGPPPGHVGVQEVYPAAGPPASFTHHCDPAALLSLAASVFGAAPAATWMVTVGAARLDCEECLSEPVRRALPQVVSIVRELLELEPSGQTG